MLPPVISAGIKSLVNWILLKSILTTSASVLAINVLAIPGTPSNSTCPSLNKHAKINSITVSLPTILLFISFFIFSKISLVSCTCVMIIYLFFEFPQA